MTLLLPRVIRLDPSDRIIFEAAAEPGEWAVAGAFLFMGQDVEALPRKARIAFRSGFLGVESFGFSTLVVVSEASPGERARAVETLAARLVERLGAPDLETARPAALEEIAFAAEICEGHAPGTLLALHRAHEAGAIRERFRVLRPRSETPFADPSLRGHDRAFHWIETNEEEAPS